MMVNYIYSGKKLDTNKLRYRQGEIITKV